MKRLNYIVQCLETWKEAYPESWYEPSELALTYARELRELEPVIWKSSGDGWSYEKPLFPATPLYDLGD